MESVACTTQVLTVAPAPADELEAVVFTRSCSPRDITINLSILPRMQELADGPGNVLVLVTDPDRGTISFPRVGWQGSHRLDVRLDTTLAVRRLMTEAAAVQITYLTLGGDPLPGKAP